MSVILTESEAKALLEKVLKYSKADECEVNLSGEYVETSAMLATKYPRVVL